MAIQLNGLQFVLYGKRQVTLGLWPFIRINMVCQITPLNIGRSVDALSFCVPIKMFLAFEYCADSQFNGYCWNLHQLCSLLKKSLSYGVILIIAEKNGITKYRLTSDQNSTGTQLGNIVSGWMQS